MTAYIYITVSLLSYPILGWFIIRQTKNYPPLQKRIVWTLFIISSVILLCTLTHIITISQNLNWFLLTSIYLTISTLLWLTQFQLRTSIKNAGKLLMVMIFGIGYLIATMGSFFTIVTSFELQPSQRKWLTNDLIYKERNIGSGPDPSVSLKRIEVYKTIKILPLLAYRIEAKTYDTWNVAIKQNLDVSFIKDKQILYLTSSVNGFNWTDSINLNYH